MASLTLRDNLWWFQPIQVFATLGAAVNFGMLFVNPSTD